MPSLGNGISDAVRNHISIWVDDDLITIIYKDYVASGGVLSQPAFTLRMRNSAEWVRKSRKNTSTGYERLYHCKSVKKATLIVHSPPADDKATSYIFYIENKPVAGGKTKLSSTHVTKTVSKKDKTTVVPHEVAFVKFSEEELRKMRTQAEYGDGYDHFEFEREG